MSPRDPDTFVGRTDELAELRSALSLVRSGQPRTVLIGGPAGIGKSALVERFLAPEEDVRVLRASGEHWEAMVAFGVVEQLMRVAGANSARLLAARQAALPPEEPVTVGMTILELLEEAQRRTPVVVLVEDAHWADTDSLRALMYALRRLVSARVLTLLTVRDEELARLPEGLGRLAAGPTGLTVHLGPLGPREVQELAQAFGVAEFSARSARRLQSHCRGNPLYVRSMLEELPPDRWSTWEPVLAAPRAFAEQVERRLDVCGPAARQLVEAASALGTAAPLATVAALAGVAEPLAPLEEARLVGLLQVRDEPGIRDVGFPHPLVQAAVYEQLGPARRVRLHLAAAKLVEDDGAALRHRVIAADPPDERLAAELSAFAERQAGAGAWAAAAQAWIEAARLSDTREHREQRLFRSLDAMVGSGELVQASLFAREIAEFPPGPLRDAALGYLAVVRGHPDEAAALLASAWQRCDPVADAPLAAIVAQRRALDNVSRLDGAAVVAWSRRAIELAAPTHPVRVEAEALLGLGQGFSGQVSEGIATYEDIQARFDPGERSAGVGRLRMPLGWLRLVAGDVAGARAVLAETAPEQVRLGSLRIAAWAYVWLSRAEFLAGSWDAAVAAAGRAVALLEETGHESLRPLAQWAAVGVPAVRGEWAVAAEHARRAAARPGDYELMVVAGGMARAQVAAAQGDPEGVLRALEPVLAVRPRDGVDEPGFWPWPVLYAEALVGAGRLAEAEAFLAPQEELTAARGRALSVAGLARVRGRLEAAAGRADAAEAAFRQGLRVLGSSAVPFPRGLVELAFGQVLRRHGRRRAAAEQLMAARGRFAELGARPYVERCERELSACGLAPAKRSEFDPARLTAQELAVARLVAGGMSNRQVAAELFISVKTVQFHLTRIYSKLRVNSRAELAAQLRDEVEYSGAGTENLP